MSSQWQLMVGSSVSVLSLAWVAWIGQWHSMLVPTVGHLHLVGLSGLCIGLAIASGPSHVWCLLLSHCPYQFHVHAFQGLWCSLTAYVLAQALRTRVLPLVPWFTAGNDVAPCLGDVGDV